MRAHRLKIHPDQFMAAKIGDKTHELRRADRDFRVGDYLLLQEFTPLLEAYTGESVGRKITHILKDWSGLHTDFVILSVAKADPLPTANMRASSAMIEWVQPK